MVAGILTHLTTNIISHRGNKVIYLNARTTTEFREQRNYASACVAIDPKTEGEQTEGETVQLNKDQRIIDVVYFIRLIATEIEIMFIT